MEGRRVSPHKGFGFSLSVPPPVPVPYVYFMQRQLEDNPWKSPLPSRGAEGRAREKSLLMLPGTPET